MVDKLTGYYPDFDCMIGTVRRKLKGEKVKLCKKFPKLFQLQVENGYIPDDVFYYLGHPKDINLDGDVMEKHATISQANQQCSKCLLQKYQRNLRQKKITE